MRKFLFILLIGSVFIFWGCAGQRVLISSQEGELEEPDPRAVNRYVDGVIHDLNQNYAAALLAYQEALLYDSTSSALYLAIGKDYLRLGKKESALVALRRCLNLDPKEVEAVELLSRIYIDQGELDLAEKSYKEILAQDPNRVDAYYNLAVIYLQRNQVEKAVEMYERIVSLPQTPNPQILLGLGELYIDLNRFEEAAEVFRQLIELDPTEGVGYYGLGVTKEALGDTSGAVASYSTALRLSPDLNHARERLSRIYLARRNWDEAVRIYSEAVERDSTDLASWLEIGEIHRQMGDTTSALETLDWIQRRFPERWQPYLDKGRILLDQQKFLPAYQEFKKVIELNPETFWGWLFTGISLAHLDSLQESRVSLRKALDFAPNDPLGNYYLGSVLSQLNRSREAIPYLESALRVRPDWVAVLSTLAGVYESLEEYTVSDSLFETALRVDPENALVLNNYGYSLSERDIRLEEALRMAQKAVERNPDNGAYLDTMGWIYFKMGEYEKALEYIEKAHSIRRESAEVAEHLGDVYDKLGLKERARQAWEEALKLDQDNVEILKKLGRESEE